MADSTRFKSTLDRLEDAIAKLTSSQLNLTVNQTTMSTKLNDLTQKMSFLETNQPSPSSSSANPTFSPPSSAPYRMKLKVPQFDGSDPLGWIFKITQFFNYHVTTDSERLTILSFYMDGPALAWFQWMSCNGQIASWSDFLNALKPQFDSSHYDDPTRPLFTITHRGTVIDYLTEFEALANRIIGLPPPFLLSCFISGLSPDIRREIQALQPLKLLHATALAHLQEEKLLDLCRFFRGHTSSQGSFAPRLPRQALSSSLLPPPPLLPTPPKSTIPYKRILLEELAMQREKGVCFN